MAIVDKQVSIEMTGPSDVWFGVAFNANKMSDLPYTIIANGTGEVFELKMANHLPGSILPKTINVTENRVTNYTRYIKITRAILGKSKDYYKSIRNEALNCRNGIYKPIHSLW